MLRKTKIFTRSVMLLAMMGSLMIPSIGFSNEPTGGPTQELPKKIALEESSSKASPANLTPQDQSDAKELPVSLIKGRVSTQAARYILGPGDVIDIKIRDLADFDQSFSIRPDGFASIHPFGEYKIDGTDLQGLETWLEEKFKFYLVKPEITTNLKEMRPALIYVSGAVRRPGVYQYIRQGQNNSTIKSEQQEKVELTLSNVLKRSGGVTVFADIQNVTVVRKTTGMEERFNLLDLLNQGNDSDVWLSPGDSVKIPKMDFPMSPDTFTLISQSTFFDGKLPVVVLGAVSSQGQIDLDPDNNTLNAAISKAGGYTRSGKQGTVVVQRPTTNGGYSQITVHPLQAQFSMLPGDVVYVANSKKSKLEYSLKVLSGIALPLFFSSSSLNNLQNVLGGYSETVSEGTNVDGDSFKNIIKSKSDGLFD